MMMVEMKRMTEGKKTRRGKGRLRRCRKHSGGSPLPFVSCHPGLLGSKLGESESAPSDFAGILCSPQVSK